MGTALLVGGIATLVAARCVWRMMDTPGVAQPMKRWVWHAARAMVVIVLGSAAWLRYRGADRLLWGHDENANLLIGIRLHLLPWFNVGAPVEQNFFKSLVMGVHGLGDTVFFYLVVGICRLFHVPVSEHHLFLAGATLSLVSIVLLYGLMQRLFDTAAGLLVMAFAAWHPSLVGLATSGYQLNFVFFLQIAVLAAYVLHVSVNRWSVSLLAAMFMVLCAGSEIFYLAPILLLVHWACRHSSGAVGWFDRKNLVVWSGFGLMMLVNLMLLLVVGHRIPLTLFGRLWVKRMHEASMTPDYGWHTLMQSVHGLMTAIPAFEWVVVVSMGLAWWLTARRSRPMARVFVGYLAYVAGCLYVMKSAHGLNAIHLLLAVMVVVGLAAVTLLAGLMRVPARRQGPTSVLAGVAGVLILAAFARPWRMAPAPEVPAAYRGIKAAAYAIRELGAPARRVMVLSPHLFIPSTMEYYLGLAASAGHRMPIHLFYLREPDARYLPSRLAQRLGIGTFDYYLEFPQEAFPGKAAVLEDLKQQGLHPVAEVIGSEGVSARVYAHRATPLRRIQLDEGNRGFERTYARWERLFSDRHAGVFFHFGADY